MQNDLLIKYKFKNARQRSFFEQLRKKNIFHAFQYLATLQGSNVAKFNSGSRAPLIAIRNEQKSTGKDKLENRVPRFWAKEFEKMLKTDTGHKPLDFAHGDWIGVEIECFIPHDSVNYETDGCECECTCDEDLCAYCQEGCQGECNGNGFIKALGKLIERKKIKRVSVKSDGSIEPDDGYFAVEIAILFNKNDRSNLEQLCALLKNLGAEVNESCGMHVHLDQRDVLGKNENILKRRANNLGKCLPFLASLVPESRRKNSYCQLKVSKTDRYSAVNLTALDKFNTIEVRLHSSTTELTKINNWIDILLMITLFDKNLPEHITDLEKFCMVFDVPEKLISYCEMRRAKFGNKEIKVEESDHDTTNATSDAIDFLRYVNDASPWWDIVDQQAALATPRVTVDDRSQNILMSEHELANRPRTGYVREDGTYSLGSIQRDMLTTDMLTEMRLPNGRMVNFRFSNLEHLSRIVRSVMAEDQLASTGTDDNEGYF